MPILPWINDKDLNSAVKALLEKARAAKKDSVSRFGSNVVDPFSALFEIAGFVMTHDAWYESEVARQAQKTLQNFIGEFHQTILGSCKGWTDLKKGRVFDLKNQRKKIVAEIKNKHNTVSGTNLSDHFKIMDEAVMGKNNVYKGFTAYYVKIIPKSPKRFNKVFSSSDRSRGQKTASNVMVRQIDGASFYELVTGDEHALADLFKVLPSVIEKQTKKTITHKKKLLGLFQKAYG